MRQLLINIFLFLVCLTFFCLAAPQASSSDATHSNASLIVVPVKQTPRDSTSAVWKKDSTSSRGAIMLSKKMVE